MSLPKSLLSYLIRRLKIIQYSVKINRPKLTSLIIALSTKCLNCKGAYTILCLHKSVFIDDLEAMYLANQIEAIFPAENIQTEYLT